MSDTRERGPGLESFPFSEEAVDRARDIVQEHDDTVKHNRILTREQTIGQFMIGAAKRGIPTSLMIFGADKIMEITGDRIPITDKFSAAASAGAAIFFGVKRVLSRRGDEERVREFARERAAQAPPSS